MLIELLQIARNLAGQGIATGLVHTDFGTPGLSTLPTLKAVLNEDGEVVRLLSVTKDEESSLWTLRSGKFKFFPAVRLKLAPALQAPVDLLEKQSVSVKAVAAVLQLAQHASARKVDSEMMDCTNKNRQRIRDWDNHDEVEILNQIHRFSTAFDKFCESPEVAALNLLSGIERALQLPCDDKTLGTFANLLLGKCFFGKRKEGDDRIQLCFDFKPENDIAFTLYSPRVRRVVLECLAKEKVDPAKKNMKMNALPDVCALTGRSAELLTTPFPDWSAPPVINKPLSPFSKFGDAACNYRYHRADTHAFPVGVETARSLVAALNVITNEPQGSNWRAIRNGKFDKQRERQDVLIAYPTMRIEDLRLVSLFARAEESGEDGTKEFQDQARVVVEGFTKITPSVQVADYIVILLIRQISSGQIQLAYSASPTRTGFVAAIDAWSESANNLPANLRVPLVPRTKIDKVVERPASLKNAINAIRWFKPRLLFPEEISRLLSHQWIRSGAETASVEAPSIGQILDLFLRKSGVWQAIATNLLEVTLARTSVLLTHAGHVLHRDDPVALVGWSDFSLQSKAWPDYAVSQTLSLIGSLLHAMNSHVKNYVEEPAYRIGK